MNLFAKTFSLVAASLVAGSFGLSTVMAQSTSTPHFNAFNDVAGIGSESDFIRIGKDAASGVNTLEACEDGQVIDFWIYVHNSTAATGNGADYSGDNVARNTVLDVDVNADNTVAAIISADNAATVTDNAQITCADGDISLEYLGVSDFNTTAAENDVLGTYKLAGDPINGAQIGFDGGVVPGCWDYRGRVNIQVKVVKDVVETPEVETPVVVTPVVETPEEPKAPVVTTPVANVPNVPTITDTGASSVVALFAAVTAAGTVMFRTVAAKR